MKNLVFSLGNNNEKTTLDKLSEEVDADSKEGESDIIQKNNNEKESEKKEEIG